MIYLVALIVTVATVASTTRLARTDVITAPWRVKLNLWSERTGRGLFWLEVLECFRCTSVWISAPVTLFFGSAALVLSGVGWITWLVASLLWIPTSFGISYLAYLLWLLEGDN